MCLLTYFPPNIQPDISALYTGAYSNSDGHGYAIVNGDDLIVQHSMEIDLIKQFEKDRRRHSQGPAMFHSRWATHGAKDLNNCHPFSIGRDSRTVIAHNGVLPSVPSRSDWRSDTRYAADVVIPKKFGSLRYFKTRKRVEKWMGGGNKIVILTTDHSFKSPAFILNEDAGEWEDGIWYSNSMYKPYGKKYSIKKNEDWAYWTSKGVYDLDDDIPISPTVINLDLLDTDYMRCTNCNAIVALEDDDCVYCGKCIDCGMEFYSCMCYKVPNRWEVM